MIQVRPGRQSDNHAGPVPCSTKLSGTKGGIPNSLDSLRYSLIHDRIEIASESSFPDEPRAYAIGGIVAKVNSHLVEVSDWSPFTGRDVVRESVCPGRLRELSRFGSPASCNVVIASFHVSEPEKSFL